MYYREAVYTHPSSNIIHRKKKGGGRISTNFSNRVKIEVKLSCNRPWKLKEMRDVEDPTFSDKGSQMAVW
jgi:hypothetical protein